MPKYVRNKTLTYRGKKMKKIILSFFIILSVAYAAVPDAGEAAPEPDYSQMLPTEEEQEGESGNQSLVGDDDLHQESISVTKGYKSGLGTSNLEKEMNSEGKMTYYVDGVEVSTFSENESSDEYKESLTSFDLNVPETDEEKEARAEALANAKALRNQQNIENGMTPQRMEDMFLEGVSPESSATSFVYSKMINPETVQYDEGVDEIQSYSDKFGYETKNNEAANTNNAGKLAEAYEFVEEFKTILNSKYSNKSISCFVSRQLIPKYFCPMPGRTNTLFGGDASISESAAKEECGGNCTKEIGCLPYKIIDDLNFTVRDENLPIYPNWNDQEAFFTSNDIDNKMQIKNVSYKVLVSPSSSFEGTDEDFENFLAENRPKYKFSLVKRADSLGNPPLLLVDRQTVEISSSITSITIPVLSTGENLFISFYKPYFSENAAVAEYVDGEKWNSIGSIEIADFNGKYTSTNLYFCPYTQLVDAESECQGTGGEMIRVDNGTQILNICTDSDHKVGPDLIYGGFYSSESCSANCIESKDCLPTYSHYSSYSSDDLYRVEVSCVDDPDNTACSVEKCKALIREEETQETKPLNEWVIYNDDELKQTIANTVLQANVIRPKFNLDSELNVSASYSEMFQTQMKDAAFQNMIDDGSYNRIAYRIGEESPRKMSYSTQIINGVQTLILNIKPQSKIIDDGNEYNLYVIMELDQLYKPIAGLFMIDGQNIQADRDETSGLQLRDKTYAIRQASTTAPWKVFKKLEKTHYKKVYDVKRCPGEDAVEAPQHYWDDILVPDECIIEKQVMWPATPYMTVDRNVFYNPPTDSFVTYSSSEKAEIFNTQEFSSDVVENMYLISGYTHRDIEDIPGGLIRDQVSYNHDLSFKKIYNTEYGETKARGYVYNYKMYAFYDEDELTYEEVIEKLTEENAFYEKINPGQYSTTIKDDGEINNNIEPFILGDKEISTVSVEMSPFLEEEGQKVFKFLFLHDDSEGDDFVN